MRDNLEARVVEVAIQRAAAGDDEADDAESEEGESEDEDGSEAGSLNEEATTSFSTAFRDGSDDERRFHAAAMARNEQWE